MRSSPARFLATLGCASMLGCAPSLAQNPPREANRVVPGSFLGAPAGSSPAENAAQKSYDQFFADPDLKKLIGSALQNNQELNIRLQEVMIAKSEVMSREGEYLPKVQAGVGAGVDRVGEHTRFGVLDEESGVPTPLQQYGLGLSASWEVDVWKKLRSAKKAASFRYLASIEGRNFMVTQLVSEIAESYYELIALDTQLEVLRNSIALQTNALEVVKLEKQAARVTELAVQRFSAELLKNQSRKFELEQRRVEAENRINFLVGRVPQPVERDPARFKDPVPDVARAGVPSQLLENRPDVREAELELEAQRLDVKAAKAAFYPALRIDARVGYESFNVKHLFTTPASLAANVAGNLVAPLLNRKAIKAQYYAANARQLQAVFNYERTLLKAFTEVVNTLAKVNNLKQASELQAQQVDTLTKAIDISNVLFQSARADYMEVLLTRRDALDAQMELIETKSHQLKAMVRIYQALGGGWRI